MTDEELNEIRERVQAATEGPWQQDPPDGWDVWSHGGRFYLAQCRTPEDAAFIASSRQDMAALLAEVERQRDLTAEAEAQSLRHKLTIERLRAENAAMREIVQAVATIEEAGTGWLELDARPYDWRISVSTIDKARALLAREEEQP